MFGLGDARPAVLDQIVRKYLLLIDAALVTIAILMRITDAIVFLFHFVFVLLAIGAFYWNLRSFFIRSLFWVSLTAVEVLWAVTEGKTQFEELIEIPLLTIILGTVFIIASQRSKAQMALQDEHASLEKALIERDALQVALTEKAFHDPLTKLPNRALLFDRLQFALTSALRNDQCIGVLFLDLDGFKEVNDKFGHQLGDQLLVAVAERLRKPVRLEDTVSRLGGDEFVIVINRGVNENDVTEIAGRIIEELSRPFELGDIKVEISASIGIVISTADVDNIDELVGMADKALYQAKAGGKSTFVVFEQKSK